MRPIRLTMTAFGTYVDRTVLDFRGPLERRLFGIYGPTGSGKTSILDGICFALFGESSGDERTSEEMRSHFAQSETQTEVELIFEIGSKTYLIRRSPPQTTKGHGGKDVDRPHTASLFDCTGLPLDGIDQKNCGAVLAERKVKEVTAKIGELLGYSSSQFRQVVLLPQGKFRELLTADSKVRSDILRGLFDVRLYERFTASLKTEASELASDIREWRARAEVLLSQHDVQSAAELQVKIDESANTLVLVTTAAVEAETALRAVMEARNAADVLESKFAAADRAEEEYQTLLEQQEEYQGLEATIRKVESAQGVVSSADLLRASLTARDQAKQRLSEAEAAFDAEKKQFVRAREAADASRALAPHREKLAARVHELQALVETVNGATRLQKQLKDAQGTAETAVKAHDKASTQISAAEKKVQQAREEDGAARERAQKLTEMRVQYQTLNQECTEARAYAAEGKELEGAVQQCEKASAESKAAEENLKASERACDEADRLLIEAQASILASKLRPGEACPVCGSEHHPRPAHQFEVTPAGRTDRLNAAKSALQSARQRHEKASNDLAAAMAIMKNLKAAHDARPIPVRAVSEIEAELRASAAEGKALAALPAPEQTTKKVDEATEALAGARRLEAETRDAMASAREAVAAAKAAADQALSGVEERLRSPQAAQKALEGAQKESHSAVEKHERAVREEGEHERKKAATEERVASFTESLNQLSAGLAAREKEYADTLLQNGLTSAEFEELRRRIPGLQNDREAVAKYRTALDQAKGQRALTSRDIAGKPRPDVKAITEQHEAASAAHTKATEVRAATEAQHGALIQTEAQVSEIEKEIAAAEERYRVVGELANLAQGNNGQRIRLVDYAIAAYLDRVLEQANIRFQRMSQSRFSLYRKTTGDDGRSKAGLDIEVYDAHTGRRRNARTLSGGEGFMASLSLALGLADVVQSESGGIKLDVIFVDEGFGQLDPEALDHALQILRGMAGHVRAVGLISHVEEVKRQVPAGFEIRPGLRGSTVSVRADA